MADEFDEHELPEDEFNALSSLLSDPSVWDEPNRKTEDAIVAAIAAERDAQKSGPDEVPALTLAEAPSESENTEASNVVPITRARSSVPAFLAGAVAASVLLVAVFVGSTLLSTSDGTDLALEATELAPEAAGVATISEMALGTQIILDVSGLPPAEPGTYYEAWLRIDADAGVSAGTFHLRGGDGTIELWAGVTPDEYPLFTITLQSEAQEESSGQVVLRGLIESE